MVLTVLFWILWILCVIGCFIPESPFISRGRWVVILLLVGVLGLKVLGSPMH
jgi:hypothetical protein